MQTNKQGSPHMCTRSFRSHGSKPTCAGGGAPGLALGGQYSGHLCGPHEHNHRTVLSLLLGMRLAPVMGMRQDYAFLPQTALNSFPLDIVPGGDTAGPELLAPDPGDS